LRKILNKHFYFSFVAGILIFGVLLWYHYSWWIALLNSIAVVIVGVLLDPLEKIINRNRNRDFPRWFTALIFGILIFIISIFRSHFSDLEFLWIWVFAVYIFTIIFPGKTES
jgi:hypothetical protein